MAKAIIYKQVLELTGLKKSALEKRIGLANGAIGKAISRDSVIPQETLDIMAKEFPELDLKQMQIDLLNSGSKESKSTEKQAETPAINTSEPDVIYDSKDKLIAALEKWAEAERIARMEAQEAKEAYKEVARISGELSNSVRNLEQTSTWQTDAIVGIRVWASETAAPFVEKTSTQVLAELLRKEKEARQQRIADSQSDGGKRSSSKAMSQEQST